MDAKPNEEPSELMKDVLDELSSSSKFLVDTKWYQFNALARDVAHQTLAGLLRRGLVQKRTIEVYDLTDAGRQFIKEQRKRRGR